MLWWMEDNLALGPRARDLITSTEQVLVSIASLWEVAIKHRIGKLRVSCADISGRMAIERMELLPITPAHLTCVEALRDAVHGDPFDHLIIAQAQSEAATIITKDPSFARYDVPCIAAGR
jgi:PIN domain nuclease of toxin-antitoxin system